MFIRGRTRFLPRELIFPFEEEVPSVLPEVLPIGSASFFSVPAQVVKKLDSCVKKMYTCPI
jgi:hypothetical protein